MGKARDSEPLKKHTRTRTDGEDLRQADLSGGDADSSVTKQNRSADGSPRDKLPKAVHESSSESNPEFNFDDDLETCPKSETSPEQCNTPLDEPNEDSELTVVGTSAQQSELETDELEFQFHFEQSGFLEFQMPDIFSLNVDFGTLIPRTPSSLRPSDFYFAFHRERINGYYYYSYYDYQQLFTKGLLAIAGESNAVYFALIAFSALVYSLRVDPTARHAAYCFYSLTVKELRSLLDKPMDGKESQIATVCAMQLSSFDRFSRDDAKCFRHLEGAAKIMMRYTSAIEQCSTSLGRSIIEWFFGFEDIYCIFAAYHSILPTFWRRENIRIRASIAEMEYKYLTSGDRIPRVLDDIWAQMYIYGYQMREILEETPRLKTLQGREKDRLAAELEISLRDFDDGFMQFMRSSLVQEVLEPSEFGLSSNIVNRYLYKYPLVGTFKVAALCMQTYIRSSLHPLLCAEMEAYTPLEGTAEELSVELCRAYAGLELCVSEEILYTCHAPLIIAALNCPPELRMWVYSKLMHLDNLGQSLAEPVKQNLASLWNMPELLTTAVNIEELIQDLEDVNLEDLEPLTQFRGIFLDR